MSKIEKAAIEAIADKITRAEFMANTLQEFGHEVTTLDILDVLAIVGYQLLLDTTDFPNVAYEEYLALNSGGESAKPETETEETPFTEPIKPQRTRANLRDAYPRNGFGWTAAEDRNLMVYRLANLDVDEMADLLGRSPKAIRDHILVVDGKRLPNGTVVR